MSSSDTSDAKIKKTGPFSLYLRSCHREIPDAQEGIIEGIIPFWLKGNFLRNGPGIKSINGVEFNHLFDGLSLMQNIEISNGSARFQSRFLRSDSFIKDMRHNRIVVSEFGTRAMITDPCLSLWQKFKVYFTLGDIFTDNDIVGFYPLGDEVYAVTDSPFIRRIDPETLETYEKVNLYDVVGVNTATSHPHVDDLGNVYNLGSNVGSYNITFFPKQDPLNEAKILASIPCHRPLTPAYFHSFGMTDNYFIFVEQPLIISIPDVLMDNRLKVSKECNSNILKWRPEYLSRFWLINRKSNQVLEQVYYTEKPFAFFHVINSYEEADDEKVIIDICTYENADFLKAFFVQEIKDADSSEEMRLQNEKYLKAKVNRFVLPVDSQSSSSSEVIVRAQTLFTDNIELPQINYKQVNGKKYQFLYGIIREEGRLGLVKADVIHRTKKTWFEADCYPSEPIFVHRPTNEGKISGHQEEDDGIVLSLVIYESNEHKTFLLILDAVSFKEIARSSWSLPTTLPPGFHGMFRPYH